MPDFPVVVCLRLVVVDAPDGQEARKRARADIANVLQAGMCVEDGAPKGFYDLQVFSSELVGPPISST